jgi:diguanylate cyclase (GGDEF)-like protein
MGGPPLLHDEDRVRVLAAWRHSLETGRAYDVEHRMRWADGEYRWVHTRAYPRLDRQGAVVGWYGATEDINERKLAEQRLGWLATHDSLTGLGNRLHFRNQLETELDLAGDSQRVALLLLDLDGFKQVNDAHGHDAGDALLIETARRLRDVVGRRGLVSRLGGDEFTVIIPRVKSEGWLNDTLERLLRELAQPVVAGGVLLHTRASIGVAVYPEDDASVSQLLKDADLALYAAKSRGRGCWVRFDPELRGASLVKQ